VQKVLPSPAVQKGISFKHLDSTTSHDKKPIEKKPTDNRPVTALTGGRKNPDLANNKSSIHEKKVPITKGP
jgi:hypothetical protein